MERSMIRLIYGLIVCALPSALLAGEPMTFNTGWTHDFEVLAEPAISDFSRNQLAVRADGQPVFGGSSLVRASPAHFDMLFLGPGPDDFHQVISNAVSPTVYKVQSSGNSTFLAFSKWAGHCAVAKIGINQFEWTRDMPSGAGGCVTMEVTESAIHVVTENRQWVRVSLSGSIAGVVSLGSGRSVSTLIRELPDGGTLIAEVPEIDGLDRLELSRWSGGGSSGWHRTYPVNYGEPIDMHVSPNGRYTVAFFANEAAGSRLNLWRGGVDGADSTAQSFPSLYLPGDLVCIVDEELRTFVGDGTTFQIDRYVPGSGPTSSVVAGLRGGASRAACHGDRMFVLAATVTTPYIGIHEIDDESIIWSRDFPENSNQTIAFRATSTGVYAATMAFSSDRINRWTLRQFSLDGVPLPIRAMPAKRVESRPFDLAGSADGDPVLVTRHGSGLHLVAVDDVAGAQWTSILRGKHSFGSIPDDFYAIRRIANGGVDAIGGELDFFRLNVDGSEYFRTRIGTAQDPFPELHYPSNGDVLVRGGPSSVRRIRNNQEIGLAPAHFAVGLGASDRVDVMTFESSPQSQSVLYELDASFQPIPSSRRDFPAANGDWMLHGDGIMDHVENRTVRRFDRSGVSLFSSTHESAPPGFAARNVGNSPYGVASIWQSAGQPATFHVVRTGPNGNLDWFQALPFSAKSFAMDVDGLVGVAGANGPASFAMILDRAGQVVFERTCADERQCARTVSAIGTDGGRWFIAGTQGAPEDLPRRTYVSEIHRPSFRSGFESGEE